MEQIILSADYSICNFEAPIEGFGKPAGIAGANVNQKSDTIIGLRTQGFDILPLANNHMQDYESEVLEATLQKAKRHKLDTIGAVYMGRKKVELKKCSDLYL